MFEETDLVLNTEPIPSKIYFIPSKIPPTVITETLIM
jgi:hypothetical protein